MYDVSDAKLNQKVRAYDREVKEVYTQRVRTYNCNIKVRRYFGNSKWQVYVSSRIS